MRLPLEKTKRGRCGPSKTRSENPETENTREQEIDVREEMMRQWYPETPQLTPRTRTGHDLDEI